MTKTSLDLGRPAPFRRTAARPRASAGAWAAAGSLGLVTGLLLRVRSTPDVDLWLHLRIGDLLRSGDRFGPPPDPLASLADREYVPTQWLSQVAMSVVHDSWGMAGIQVTRLFLVLALGALVLAAARITAPPAASAMAAGLTMFGTAASWGERPQLAGMVLLAGSVLAWWRALQRGTAPWVVLPIIWLWANVHGSWVLGVAVGGLFTLGGLLDGRWSGRRALVVASTLPTSVAVAALTPVGVRGLLEPFRVGEVARLTANEWQQPSLLNPLLLAVIVGGLVAMFGVLRDARLRWTRLLAIIAAVALAMWMVRTIAVGAVLLGPALAVGLTTLAPGRGSPSRDAKPRAETGPWAFAAAVCLLIGGWHALASPFPPPLSPQVDAAVGDLIPESRLVVDGRAVGWVQWAHRDQRPLRDLRAEVYSPPVALAYDDFKEARPGWQDYLAAQGITAVLADRSEPLDAALSGEPGWRVAAEDADFRLWIVE